MNKEKSEKLIQWINSLPLEKVQQLAYTSLSELIFTDSVKYYPGDEDLPDYPYWEASGKPLID